MAGEIQKRGHVAVSTRRSAVEAWLVAHGVEKSHLTHAGHGDGRPVADNGTEEGCAKNRRVELVKMSPSQPSNSGQQRLWAPAMIELRRAREERLPSTATNRPARRIAQ
jgi:hypothetical protein